MFFYPYYIKKEDAKEFARRKRKFVGFILLFAVLVFGLIQFFTGSKVLKIYQTVNEPTPMLLVIRPYVMGIFFLSYLLMSVYFLGTSPDMIRLESILNKYKEGEMIKTQEIVEGKYELFIFILLILPAAYIIVSTLMPIYQLTSKFQ